MTPALPIAAASVVAACVAAVKVVPANAAASRVAPAGAAATRGAADGKAIYREHCAGCHGAEGGGDGPLAADLRFKPRAFKEGKFAFGNTPDAMAKTVMSGVPGREVPQMPAFKGVLADEEIAAVVAYVRTLMPPIPELTPADMKLEPRDEAKVVRGLLAPLKEGEKPIARGLLVGLPSGFSFEYAADNVHVLAVRRGEFVTRSDWEGRGGRPLTPLGAPLWIAPEPKQWVPFAVGAPPAGGGNVEWRVALARLRSTRALGEEVELDYDLVDLEGRVRAHVVERPREVVVAGAAATTGAGGGPASAGGTRPAGGVGIVQELEILAAGEPVAVLCSLAIGSDPKLPLPAPVDAATAIPSGGPPLLRHASEQKCVADASGWWVIRPSDASFACVRIEAPRHAIVTRYNGERHDCVDVQVTAREEPVVLRRTTILRADATLEVLESMTRELEGSEPRR
jgi:mono/diheme cytochrome c family protein